MPSRERSSKCSRETPKSIITMGNRTIPYRVFRRDVKYRRIEVRENGEVLVIVPRDFPDPDAFLLKKVGWVLEKLEKIDEYREFSERINSGGKFPLFGELYKVRVKRGPYNFAIEKDVLLVSLPDTSRTCSYMERKIRESLKGRLRGRVESYSQRIGVEAGEVRIKKMKSKWGSCSHLGNLNFNLKIAGLPEYLFNFVVAHEVIHLKHHRHSKEFKEVCRELFPNYKELQEEVAMWWYALQNNPYWRRIYGNL